jgi:hypothetical protein
VILFIYRINLSISRPNCKWIQRVGFLGMIRRMHLPIKSYANNVDVFIIIKDSDKEIKHEILLSCYPFCSVVIWKTK